MSSSEDERLQRLTEMARRVWPDARIERDGWDGDVLCVLGPVMNARGRMEVAEHLRLAEHPRALDALEAALLVMLGEGAGPSQQMFDDSMRRCIELEERLGSLEMLAAEWDMAGHGARDAHRGDEADAYFECAAELRERVKGGER